LRVGGFTLGMGVLVWIATFFILSFLGTTLVLSFQTTGLGGWRWSVAANYVGVFSQTQTIVVLKNSLLFAVTATAVALALGLPLAWLIERTDLGGKTPIVTAMLCSLLVPGFASAMGWLFLVHPRIGMLNRLLMAGLGLSTAPFNVLTIWGMGIVMGLNLTPLAFIMSSAALRAIDNSFEDAARISGARFFAVVREILLPLATPALVSAAIYIFTIGFGTFDIPAIIGWGNRIFTFSTDLYLIANPQDGIPDYGQAAAFASIVLGLAVMLTTWSSYMTRGAHRFAVVTGKGYRPRLVPLRWGKYVAWAFVVVYIVVAIVLPLAVVVWTSLLPFLQIPSARSLSHISLANYRNMPWGNFLDALEHTALLAASVPVLVLVFSFAFSWIALRTRLRGRAALDTIAFLPHAVPSIVFAVGVLLFSLYGIEHVVHVYGTEWILLLAFVGTWLSYGTRMTNANLIQVHRELEESAHVSGASVLAIVGAIVLPLMSRGLALAWIYLVILTMRELTLTVMLTTPGNATLPTMIWNIWLSGEIGKAAASVVCFIGCMLPLILAYGHFLHRAQRGASGRNASV
jgi:iron(III) transport system permease protein